MSTYQYVTWFRYHGDESNTHVGVSDPFKELREHGLLHLQALGPVTHIPLDNVNIVAILLDIEDVENEIQFAQEFRQVVYENITLPNNTSWLSPIRLDKAQPYWMSETQQERLEGVRKALVMQVDAS